MDYIKDDDDLWIISDCGVVKEEYILEGGVSMYWWVWFMNRSREISKNLGFYGWR